ncbi:MAG TPA: DUF4157 domain-containing protein [Kofleriaceae bacterium]|jgi:hypothetical protein
MVDEGDFRARRDNRYARRQSDADVEAAVPGRTTLVEQQSRGSVIASGDVPGKSTLAQQHYGGYNDLYAEMQHALAALASESTAATSPARDAFPFQSEMERAFGTQFSDVHASLGVQQHGARATTRGNDIAFTSSSPDKELVAHELVHIIQQRRGGTTTSARISAEERSRLEDEAHSIASRVASGGIAGAISGATRGTGLRDDESTAKDVLPGDQFILVNGDRLKLHFRRGAENAFYVDADYEGPFDVAIGKALALRADVDDKKRKFNTRILQITANSVVLDLYGDGLEIVTLTDTVSAQENSRIHALELAEPRGGRAGGSIHINLPHADGTNTPPGVSQQQAEREQVVIGSFQAIDKFTFKARRFGDTNQVAVHLDVPGQRMATDDWLVPVAGKLDQLSAKVLRNDGRDIEIDLNGDGKPDLKVVHTVEATTVAGGNQVRTHHLRHFDKAGVLLEGNPRGTVVVVTGPAVSVPSNQDEKTHQPDLRVEWPAGRAPGQGDIPGQAPEPIQRAGDIIELRLDGDGDRTAELLMRIKGDAAGTIRIDLVQLSTQKLETASYAIEPRSIPHIDPYVSAVANGHDPSVVRVISSDFHGAFQDLKLFPPAKDATAKTRTYRVEFLGKAINYTFPEEAVPTNPLVKAVKPQANVANVARFDVMLGEYSDRFWVMHEPSSGRDVFSIASVGDSGPAKAQGTDLVDPTRIKSFKQVDVGPLGFGIDLDGDGKADIQIFDAMSAPLGMLSKPPVASDRDHVLTVSGPMIGKDQKWTYQVRGGKFVKEMYGDPKGATTQRDASASASAVYELGQQLDESTSTDANGKTTQGDVGALLLRIAGALTANRQQAKDQGLISERLYNAWKSLSDQLIELGPQISSANPTKKIDAKLQHATAAAARVFVADLEIETAADANSVEETPETRGGAAWSYRTNKYTGETERVDSNSPIALGPRTGPNLEIADDIEKANWIAAKRAFDQLTTGLDRWVLYRAKQLKKTDFANRQEYMLGVQSKLGELDGKAKVVRVAAMFQPDASYRSDTRKWDEIPLMLFAYQEAGNWYLKDISNPQRDPFLDSVAVESGETSPPRRLFEKLDYRRHFPKGVIHYQVPGGDGGEIITTASASWGDFLQWIGLAAAVVGISIATFGTGTVAATAAAVAFAASGAATAAGALLDLKERAEHGDLEPTAVVMDLAMIASGVASGVAALSGRIISAAAAADSAAARGAQGAAAWAGWSARIAKVAQKAYLPAIGTAAVSDGVNILAMGAETVDAIRRIKDGPGSTSDKAAAIAAALGQAVALGGIAVLSIRGSIPEVMTGKPTIVIDVVEGIPIARTAGTEVRGVKLDVKGGVDAQAAARWQSHGLEDAAANPKDPSHAPAKAMTDDSEFMKYYRRWMEQPEPKVAIGADGKPKLNYTNAEKPPKAVEEKLQRLAEGGGIGLYEKAFGNAAEIRKVEDAIAKSSGHADLQPGTPGWKATRDELVKALGADGEALVARYERFRLGPAAKDPTTFLAQREQLRRVLPDTEVDRIAHVFPEYEVYVTGSATQPGKRLAKDMDIDVVVVVPKDTAPEMMGAIEQRARGLTVRPDPQYLREVQMHPNDQLAVDVKVMTPEQFMGFATSSTGGVPNRTPMNFTRVDKPVGPDLQAKLKTGAPNAKMNTPADRLELFRTLNVNSVGFKMGSTSRIVDSVELELSNGTRRKFSITELDANHYQQGHTVEEYSFATKNINRAANSTFWPPGTSPATQQLHAKMAVMQIRPEIEAAIAAGGNPNFVSKDVSVNGITYRIGVDLKDNRITQFFPVSGSGIVPVSKTELLGIKQTLGK